MNKIAIILFAVIIFCSCKKREETPDQIQFTISTRIERNNNYTTNIDSVRVWIYDSNTKLFYLKTFTDSSGNVKIALKKDTPYLLSLLTPTYTDGTNIYYYQKSYNITSSVSTRNGKEKFSIKDFTETFTIADTAHGYGYSKTQILDPSYQ